MSKNPSIIVVQIRNDNDGKKFRQAFESSLSTAGEEPLHCGNFTGLKLNDRNYWQLDAAVAAAMTNGYLAVSFNTAQAAEQFNRNLEQNLDLTGCLPVNKTLFLPQDGGQVRVLGYQPWN